MDQLTGSKIALVTGSRGLGKNIANQSAWSEGRRLAIQHRIIRDPQVPAYAIRATALGRVGQPDDV